MRIKKGQSNSVALTLNEKRQESDSEFIVKFTQDFNGNSKVVGLTDISEYPVRSNIFNITESETELLAHGVVNLETTGQWDYTVYEMEQSSPRNLDPEDAIKIVETGICIVTDDSESVVKTFTVDETKNTPSFDEP